MARTAEAFVNPDVLAWARKSAGLSLEDAAHKVNLAPERLAEWEQGHSRPTIAQLRKLGRAYHRPIALFYLSKPPKLFHAMHDYRRIAGVVPQTASPELAFEIRRARDRREIALELLADLRITPPRFDLVLALGESADAAAARMRTYLGITREAQESWTGRYEALNDWRSALESRGVLVFQSTGLPVEEVRGFSISQSPLPAVIVNSADTPYARIFSMIHELVHIALRRGGLCDMIDAAARPPEEQKVEVFCNQVAGLVLLPTEWLATDKVVAAHRQMEWTDQELRLLSHRYSISREVVLRRLLNSGRTNNQFYVAKREQFQQEYRQQREESPGFAPPHSTAVGRAGQFFAKLVLESYYRELITSGHVAEYLDVKLKHLPKIEMAVSSPGRAALEV